MKIDLISDSYMKSEPKFSTLPETFYNIDQLSIEQLTKGGYALTGPVLAVYF